MSTVWAFFCERHNANEIPLDGHSLVDTFFVSFDVNYSTDNDNE